MFENVVGRQIDGLTMDTGVTGILLAHQWAFCSDELKSEQPEYLPFKMEMCNNIDAYFVVLYLNQLFKLVWLIL